MILVIQGWLPHYRLEVFNALCAVDSVTVVHSGKPARRTEDRFDEIILPSTSVGPFRLQRGLSELIAEKRPEAVIAMFDIRWLSSVWAMYRYDCKLPWIWWGLAPGKNKLALYAKLAVARRPNPIVFYDAVTRDSLDPYFTDKERLFIANNTFHVPQRIKGHLGKAKNRFINVGSLDARKQNDIVINAFSRILQDTKEDLRLTFIGEGHERGNLESLIRSRDLEDRVELLGQVNDPQVLGKYYSQALASVSFGQAGLAVLQSMAFGVPFITKRNAISGGEISNIIDRENGILCDDDPADLEKAMRQLIDEPDKARQLGRAAFEYYSAKANVENMVANFKKAIDFARNRSNFRIG